MTRRAGIGEPRASASAESRTAGAARAGDAGVRRPRGRSSAGALALGAVVLLALAAWLFLPRSSSPDARVALDAVLVDASASVVCEPRWLPWAREELRRAAHASAERGAELVVLAYGDGVATGFVPGPPERFLERLEGRAGAPFDPAAGSDPGATELAAALAVVEPLVTGPRHRPGALTLLAPPQFTGASPAGALARLAAAGVVLGARVPPPAEACDLVLLELALPPRVEAGSELVALARLRMERAEGAGSAACASAEIVLEVEGEGGPRTLVRSVPLSAASGDFEVPLACGLAGAGRTLVTARCQLAGDRIPENDAAAASTRAEGARVIGVTVEDELLPAAEAWLAPAGRAALPGLQAVFLAPDELGGELDGLDAVVSFDVAPRALPGPLLEAFVLRGGGWLALSGPGLLADWTPGDEPGALARLLPCAPAETEIPPRDVVLLVDGSGSMAGGPFEVVRAAAAELVGAALPGDRVSLRFFTGALEPEHLLKPRTATRAEDQDVARRAARELLDVRVPSGITFLLASLRQLARSVGEEETLALLLTDGRERDAFADELGTAALVADELARARVRLVVVAVGDAHLPLLGVLAGGVENVRRGDTLEDLREVFHRELYRAQVAEGELALALAPRASGSLAAEVASASPRAVELPPVERFVEDRLLPNAEALWTGPEGEPVLALARAGAGRTALFASRPTAGWAGRYTRRGAGEPAEFDGLLRWLARGPERADGTGAPRARLAGGVLTVTGLPEELPAEVEARLVQLGGARAERTVALAAEGGPGRDPRTTRVARVDAAATGPTALVLPGGLALAVERELPEEYARLEQTVPAEWLVPVDSPVPTDAGASRGRAHRAAPWLLGLGLALLFSAGLVRARGQGVPGSGR